MDTNARIWREELEGVDVSAEIAAAIEAQERAKREAAEAFAATVEQIPEGERLTWKVTPEQVARINAGDREALDAFYFDNYKRLYYCALRHLFHEQGIRVIVERDDLLNQVYVDLLTGLLKLRPYDRAINRAIFRSFRFAAVGGIDEIYIPYTEALECRKQRSYGRYGTREA
ncbi:MAG: hypothetical protein IJX98_05660 [Clostridia bacterium]|nr:hypothetical protein [Clostridia bacterium]